jgi:hypothetical protein
VEPRRARRVGKASLLGSSLGDAKLSAQHYEWIVLNLASATRRNRAEGERANLCQR